MPKALEEKLMKESKAKGVRDVGAYVYGTMRKTGWTPKMPKHPRASIKK